MPNKKTKIILAIAIAEFVLLAMSVVSIILLLNRIAVVTETAYSQVPGFMVADPTRTLNDGKYYLNGDTDSIYYEVKNGSIQFVFTEEKYKEHLKEINWNENEIDRTYDWDVEFWEKPRPYNVWVSYRQSPEPDKLFLSFETFNIEFGDRIVPAPGIGYSYIDENNFGSDSGPVFTRV